MLTSLILSSVCGQIRDANFIFDISPLKKAHQDQFNEIICHVNEVPHEE